MTRKAPSTAFKKGQSGNPRGRPKRDAEVAELARAHTAEALDTLAEVMRERESARLTPPSTSRCEAVRGLMAIGSDEGWRCAVRQGSSTWTSA
jgi:hypothetical protein